MQGLLADSPNRFSCPCWQSCVNSEISSLVLPLLLAPKTTNFEEVVLVGLPGAFRGRRQRHPSRRISAIRFLAGKMRLEPSPVRNSLPLARIAAAASFAAWKSNRADQGRAFPAFRGRGRNSYTWGREDSWFNSE